MEGNLCETKNLQGMKSKFAGYQVHVTLSFQQKFLIRNVLLLFNIKFFIRLVSKIALTSDDLYMHIKGQSKMLHAHIN